MLTVVRMRLLCGERHGHQHDESETAHHDSSWSYASTASAERIDDQHRETTVKAGQGSREDNLIRLKGSSSGFCKTYRLVSRTCMRTKPAWRWRSRSRCTRFSGGPERRESGRHLDVDLNSLADAFRHEAEVLEQVQAAPDPLA